MSKSNADFSAFDFNDSSDNSDVETRAPFLSRAALNSHNNNSSSNHHIGNNNGRGNSGRTSQRNDSVSSSSNSSNSSSNDDGETNETTSAQHQRQQLHAAINGRSVNEANNSNNSCGGGSTPQHNNSRSSIQQSHNSDALLMVAMGTGVGGCGSADVDGDVMGDEGTLTTPASSSTAAPLTATHTNGLSMDSSAPGNSVDSNHVSGSGGNCGVDGSSDGGGGLASNLTEASVHNNNCNISGLLDSALTGNGNGQNNGHSTVSSISNSNSNNNGNTNHNNNNSNNNNINNNISINNNSNCNEIVRCSSSASLSNNSQQTNHAGLSGNGGGGGGGGGSGSLCGVPASASSYALSNERKKYRHQNYSKNIYIGTKNAEKWEHMRTRLQFKNDVEFVAYLLNLADNDTERLAK